MIFTVPCSLKLNLTLKVGPCEDDGFHKIRTLFYRIPSPECLIIRTGCLSVPFRLFRCGEPFVGRHLVEKAYEFFRNTYCKNLKKIENIEIECTKIIPPASGLGAGSGNAAAYLRWASSHYGIKTSQQTYEASKTLGSDIPFLYSPYNAAWAHGRGELLKPCELKLEGCGVIILPKWQSNTRMMYDLLDNMRAEGLIIPRKVDENMFNNDFTAPLMHLHPEYAAIWDAAIKNRASSYGVCGSGSAACAIFKDQDCALGFIRKMRGMSFVRGIYEFCV